jgi:hypothetical protein
MRRIITQIRRGRRERWKHVIEGEVITLFKHRDDPSLSPYRLPVLPE